MNYKKILVPVCVIVIGMLIASSFGNARVAEATQCTDCWEMVVAPNLGQGNTPNFLMGVSAVSSNDVWAVGYAGGFESTTTAIAIRWNGTSWIMNNPQPVGTEETELHGVAALRNDYVWAVGRSYDNGVYQTLIYRWNGTQWIHLPTPNVANASNFLTGVTVVNQDLAWAVGYTSSGSSPYSPLILRWNGMSWSIDNVAQVEGGLLTGASAISTSAAWAVGYTTAQTPEQTITLRWNNSTSSWERIFSPSPGVGGRTVLNGVTTISDTDAWAVGQYNMGPGSADRTLALQWNGNAWKTDPTQNVGTRSNFFTGVAHIAGNHIWAVGAYDSPPLRTLIQRRTNSGWYVVPSPNSSNYINSLRSVSVVPGTTITLGGTIWAVGYYWKLPEGLEQTLTMRYIMPAGSPPPP